MKYSRKDLYIDKEYLAIRKSLDKEHKKKILKVDKLCLSVESLDRRQEYFYIYRRAYEIVFGDEHRFVLSQKSIGSPLRRLTNYLVQRAGEFRGIKFSK